MKVKNEYLKILEYFLRSIIKKDLQNKKVLVLYNMLISTWIVLLLRNTWSGLV